jgi:hypothetical protein
MWLFADLSTASRRLLPLDSAQVGGALALDIGLEASGAAGIGLFEPSRGAVAHGEQSTQGRSAITTDYQVARYFWPA